MISDEYKDVSNITRSELGYLVGSILLFMGLLKIFPLFYRLDRSQKELRYRLYHDPLTGRRNRLSLQDRVKLSLEKGEESVLMLVKINDFDTINHSIGPVTADALIFSASEHLYAYLKEGINFYHYEGSTFAFFLANDKQKIKTIQLANKLNSEFSEPILANGNSLHISLRMGASLCGGAQDTDQVTKQAARALFKAKRFQIDGVSFFTPKMQEEVDARLRIINELQNVVANGELTLYFQPKMDINKNLLGAEALVRWIQPKHGLIPPDEFIPIAEEGGIINEIGRWVMIEACTKIKQYEEEDLLTDSLVISVNVSPKEMLQSDFIEDVSRILTKAKIDSKHLCIELTESVLVDDIDGCTQTMLQLRNLGIKLSIDDFGTGYSSLSYLSNLYLDELKVDRCFVQNINKNTNDRTIVEAIVGIAQKMGLGIVVEGVETQEQVDYFHLLGCTVFQGYFFSRPLTSEAFHQLLREKSKKSLR